MHFNTIVQAAELIRSKQISPSDLTQMQLERIQQWDPHLKSYATLMAEQAVETARQAEIDIVAGDYRGPLHGIPWGLKDLLAVRGTKTTWGMTPFRDRVIDVDSTVYERLTEAGAVLVAKLTLGALGTGGHVLLFFLEQQVEICPGELQSRNLCLGPGRRGALSIPEQAALAHHRSSLQPGEQPFLSP